MIGAYPLDFHHGRLADAAAPAYKQPGVYALWLGSKCVYVGYSGHPQERLTQHRQKLRKGNHPSDKLQGATQTYAALISTQIHAALVRSP